jgi:hypothetical protein
LLLSFHNRLYCFVFASYKGRYENHIPNDWKRDFKTDQHNMGTILGYKGKKELSIMQMS